MLKFINSLMAFAGDLSVLTTPPFLISSLSLTEFPSWWIEDTSAFVAPASEADPEKRALLVLKWYLGTLNAQFGRRGEHLGNKSPLNPFLGELFFGKWEGDAAGTTQLVSEQVCHHPPVTAYYIRNEKHGIMLQGYTAYKTTLSRTFRIQQIGHAILHLDKYDEDYLITLPSFHVKGLVTGHRYLEMEGASHIYSSTGFTSRIEYSGVGLFSGKKSSFVAKLYRNRKPDEPLSSAVGQWTNTYTVQNEDSQDIEICHANAQKENSPIVADIDQQDAWESRRAWNKVTDAVRAGKTTTIGHEKSKIERAQREMRRKERIEGREWERLFFRKTENDSLFTRLVGQSGEQLNADKTGGVWRFDEEKARNVRAPYHVGTTPTG